MKKSRKTDPRDGWYEISPSDATIILEKRRANRPIRAARAQRLATAMQADIWIPNGEALIFDEEGRNLDGQHRLKGCEIAGVPITTYCVFGIPGKYFSSLDQGDARSGSDLAGTMKFKNHNLIAATARLAIEYEDGEMSSTGKGAIVPLARLEKVLRTNRERLEQSAEKTARLAKLIRSIVPVSHASFVYYSNLPSFGEKTCDLFLEKLATGVGLDASSPILRFRRRMIDLRGMKHTLKRAQRIALLIKTWNAFASNTSPGVLRWSTDLEDFPQFIERTTGE